MVAGLSLDHWLAFVAASLLMGIVPGPGVMAIVGTAVSSGRRPALAAVFGMAIGNALAMTLSLAGVGALLAASATAFAVLKLAGAAWLILLGLWTLRRRDARESAAPLPPVSARTAFSSTMAVGIFHPKTIVFFVAFVPPFISADHDYASQATLLVATFCGVLGLTDAGYALAAARALHRLRGENARRWSRRIGGGVLVAAGVATAATR